MSTFSAYGMGPQGFLVNRPLNEYEREQHLNVKKSASEQVLYDLSLIKFNSTFVECVDKWYSMRGFVAMVGGALSVIALGMQGLLLYLAFSEKLSVVELLGFPFFFVFLWFVAKFLLSDAFTYTHYPIRLNRQNRRVYAFRRDGSILKAGWDEVYWTIYNTKLGMGGGDLNVMGHLLEKDGVTIKESIALSLVDAGEPGRQNLLQFFEFFRRYMEEGPGPVLDALKPVPLIMLPGIDHQKESWFFGWEHLTGGMKGLPLLQILFQPFLLPISLFRWIVMRTSKIPMWPQWVEDECAVAPDDPWVRDGRHRA
ncbi:DUF6708 domain-containing protein [Ferribacterium limneticum]|uniref:DUF6708 domain-containing protein n=1 Tax=Ferribacterium limneticum TaxID=76259 RepID=UPI001CF9F789|nr:DUF6708 domain-containing protein [Ferribacterium limneticum]UCV30278.1 hypothetical protein KI617_09485 [Ferribacterium limneticum]UCV34197.1 hypothetical protein KI608_09485 [Ferribacterium limneticum]